MKNAAALALACALLAACPLLAEPPASQPSSIELAAQQKHDEDIKRQASIREITAKNMAERATNLRAKYAKQKVAYDEAAATAAKLQQLVRAESKLPDTSGMAQLLRDLQSQRETLLQEEAAATGRRAGLEIAIAKVDKQADARAGDDTALKELHAVVAARQAKLEHLKVAEKAGMVPAGEMDQAVADLAVARAGVATAQQRLTTGASDAVETWSRELMNLNIAGRERAARMEYIEARLRDLESAMKDQERAQKAEDFAKHQKAELTVTRMNLSAVASNDPLLENDDLYK